MPKTFCKTNKTFQYIKNILVFDLKYMRIIYLRFMEVIFESIRKIDENGTEYWTARDLIVRKRCQILCYKECGGILEEFFGE